MKKSLIIRWAVILVIVIGWTLSIFPMKDKDFLVEFNNRAKKSVAALQKKAERAEVLKEKLDGIADKNSQEYLSVSKDLAATAANTGISASQALDEWKELNRRIDCLREGKDLDGNPVSDENRIALSSYKLVEMAAHGDNESNRSIRLANFISVPHVRSANNKTVMRYVRN